MSKLNLLFTKLFIFKKIFLFISFLVSFPLFFTSCNKINTLVSDVSLSSFSALQDYSSENDIPEEKELEPRLLFQMNSSDEPKAILNPDRPGIIGIRNGIDGSRSEGALSYRWSIDVYPPDSKVFIEDPTSSYAIFTPDVPGLYLFKLIVRNTEQKNSKASYVAVRAIERNKAPGFRISTISSRSEGFPKHTRIRLRDIQDDKEVGLVEVDYGDGNQTVYQGWEIDSIGGNLNHYYLTAGVYEVKVTVVDKNGAKTIKTKTIDLRDNKLPVLKYSVNSTSGTAPFTLKVDASTSFDPDDDTPIHFYWDWDTGDSAYTTDTISTYTYTQPGIYTIEAYVRDERHEGNGGQGEFYNEFTIYVDDPDSPGTYQAPAGGSPPVLNLNHPQSFSGQAPFTVDFDASNSFDLEGDSFKVHWDFDGLSFKRYEEGLKVTKTYENPGYYPVRVVIQDSHGNEFRGWYSVLVYDPLVKEQARFFARQDDNDLKNFHFSAGPRELYGVPARHFFWNLGNGDVRRGLYTYTYDETGTYPVTLSTIDMFGNRQSVSKVLTVDNQKHAMDVRLEPFYEVVQVGQSISYTAEGSSSAISGILDFFWYMTTGFREAISFDYSYSKKGVHTNHVKVTNPHGISRSAYNWTVVNSGEGPKAIAKLSTYIGVAPLTVNFDASYSKSPGNITDYDWLVANYEDTEKSFTDSNVSYTYKNPGEQYSEIIVKDSNGNFDVNFYQVTVLDPDDVSPTNQSPTVQINTNQIVINDLEIDMEATFTDSDGNIRYTEWDWGDGVIDVFRHHENSPFHRYENYGSYTITVRVFDNMGAITTATHNITLSKPQNSQRSAGARGQKQTAQTQRVLIPARRYDDRESFYQEERQKTGCYKKSDGQMRCYRENKLRGM